MHGIQEKSITNFHGNIFVSKNRDSTRVYINCMIHYNFNIKLLFSKKSFFRDNIIHCLILNYLKLLSLFFYESAFSKEIHLNPHHCHQTIGFLLKLVDIHHWFLQVRFHQHFDGSFSQEEFLFFEISSYDVFSFSFLLVPSLLYIFVFFVFFFFSFLPQSQDFHFLLLEGEGVHLSHSLHKASLLQELQSYSSIASGKFSSHNRRIQASCFDLLLTLPRFHIYSMHQQIPSKGLIPHMITSFSQLVLSF